MNKIPDKFGMFHRQTKMIAFQPNLYNFVENVRKILHVKLCPPNPIPHCRVWYNLSDLLLLLLLHSIRYLKHIPLILAIILYYPMFSILFHFSMWH